MTKSILYSKRACGRQRKENGNKSSISNICSCVKSRYLRIPAGIQQSDLIDEIILVVGKGEEGFCRTEIGRNMAFKVQRKSYAEGEQRYTFRFWTV